MSIVLTVVLMAIPHVLLIYVWYLSKTGKLPAVDYKKPTDFKKPSDKPPYLFIAIILSIAVLGCIASYVLHWKLKEEIPLWPGFLIFVWVFLFYAELQAIPCEYYKKNPKIYKYDLAIYTLACHGAGRKHFLDSIEYRTVETRDVNGYDYASKDGKRYELTAGSKVEVMAKRENMCGGIVFPDGPVCWIDQEDLC